MNKVNIQLLQPDPDGPVFGPVIDPTDTMKLQTFVHDHVTRAIKDLLVAGTPASQVSGFAATLTNGLGVSIAAGDVVDGEGVSYELADAIEQVLGDADPALPRIDLIYATLSIDTPAELEFRPHRRLRTQAELGADIEPYPPVQYNVPTELQTKATINVRAGAPNAAPVAPALNAGEVPLWHVHVAAAQTDLDEGDLTDVRNLMVSLYALRQLVTQAGLTEIVQDIVGAYVADSTTIDATYDDAGNVLTLVVAAAYKALLDNATAAATASTLMKRDSNADVQTRDFKPTRQILFPDASLHRAAFVREHFYDLINVNEPVTFAGAAANVYETLKRIPKTTVNNPPAGGNVTMNPEFDMYLDPADAANVSMLFEVLAMDTDSINGSTLQLWNFTDGAELAHINWSWLAETAGPYRSSVFNLTGSGVKRLVLRCRRDVANAGLANIWLARLIVNPSF